MLTVRNSTASYCSDSSRTADLGQQYAVVSEWLATFHIYRHTQNAVCHIRITWYALSLPKSVYPGLFHPLWDALVWARTPSLSGSLLRGLLPALYYRLKSLAPGFGGPSISRQGSLPPSDPYFSENLRSAQVGSTTARWQRAQGISLTTDHVLNFKLRVICTELN